MFLNLVEESHSDCIPAQLLCLYSLTMRLWAVLIHAFKAVTESFVYFEIYFIASWVYGHWQRKEKYDFFMIF